MRCSGQGHAWWIAAASVRDSRRAIASNVGSHIRARLSPMSNTFLPVPRTRMHSATGLPRQAGDAEMSLRADCQSSSFVGPDLMLDTAIESAATAFEPEPTARIAGAIKRPAVRLMHKATTIT